MPNSLGKPFCSVRTGTKPYPEWSGLQICWHKDESGAIVQPRIGSARRPIAMPTGSGKAGRGWPDQGMSASIIGAPCSERSDIVVTRRSLRAMPNAMVTQCAERFADCAPPANSQCASASPTVSPRSRACAIASSMSFWSISDESLRMVIESFATTTGEIRS